MSSIEKRVFVGNLNNDIDGCLDDLYKRFQKFGKCEQESFEKHSNFAFLNMSFSDDSSFSTLKQNYNKLKFKGNILRIDLAKPDWQTAWNQQNEKDLKDDLKLSKFNAKQNWKHYKKLENIDKSWIDRKQVISGRMRETPRPKAQLRNITFRVDVNGSLKVYKCYKNKLWGYDRDKDIKDLSYKFIAGKWRNGYDHIVDRLDYTRSKQSIGLRDEIHILSKQDGENIEDADEEILEEEAEREKNTDALSQVLQNFDFDNPVSVFDSDDEFEINANKASVDKSSKNKTKDEYEEDYNQNYKKDYNQNYKKDYNQNYNEEYDDDYNQNYDEENYEEPSIPDSKTKNEEKHSKEEESEDEFIPSFPSQPDPNFVATEGTISNTDTLRSLFNPDKPNDSFTLIKGSNEDIDQDKKITDALPDTMGINEDDKTTSFNQGYKQSLFFPHLDSPFLVGQTQLTKIKSIKEEDILANWENEFWDNRGLWTRELKRLKRDALRTVKKRQSKNGGNLLI
ncbi:hypothetical protein Kpol_1038p9 [Vanderwaltozyma polyspora DSM 70294]|uniref:RRM domain-containing protein n=1 Tax=Vanderwaltozyma polyspora (strain ATCC 22028 / DSM 70294 / BCRC 21397 / CBS 2163 / NBRC 10782 / NRRL Y-8283 / UCD 57-17) TaxID=436907 RepID=A7TR00_VANPO|nr:uncharacterized protein Kpol_1038p9 [Vanderwaltozyma polyspora DSM 70294]EDO15303.1 hypothetical protein Kpol_1038p9 [Vanderwaltozyma polyspora DSM 70294]